MTARRRMPQAIDGAGGSSAMPGRCLLCLAEMLTFFGKTPERSGPGRKPSAGPRAFDVNPNWKAKG